jgi:hypothetical protein
MNRGYIYNLGQFHAPVAFDTDLNLPRAHLRVTARDSLMYGRLTALISDHLGTGRLMAGPDSPQLFYLSDRFNPSGVLFEALSEGFTATDGANEAAAWLSADVVVINHAPPFSPGLSSELTAELRRVFPAGAVVGQFEVRWH